MSETKVNCPFCQNEIRVETDMYIDEDVCYDLFVNEEDATELDTGILEYSCNKCNNNLFLVLDSELWGFKDIPVIAGIKFGSIENVKYLLEDEFDFKVEIVNRNEIYLTGEDDEGPQRYDQNGIYLFATDYILAHIESTLISDNEFMSTVSEYI